MHSQNDCDISLGGADGTFDSTTMPGWGNVGEGGWTNGLGTADTWDTPIPMDNPRGPGLPPSSQGGIVAGALDADSNTPTESFFADITGFVVGETYVVSFEQSHGGVDVNVLSTPTPIGALARWKVDLGPNSQFTPSMAFEGFGSQTWSTVSLTFVATDVTQRLTLTADKDGRVEGGAPYENVMIDNIVISTGASIDTGVSGTLDICGNDDTLIDLFDIITEEEEGGVWSQTSGTGGLFDAGAGTFVPTAGETTTSVFIYTSCNGNETTATVNVNNPIADAPSDVTVCDSYTLPPLTNGTYYDAPNASGVLLNSGTVITETTTVYVYAETGTTPNCTIDNSFIVTISSTPVLGESDASCDSNNDTYSITYTINDGNYDITVVPNTVTLDVATNTVSNIPLGTTVTITATSRDNENCTTTLSPVEPDCDCIINAPTGTDSTICEGGALTTFMATTDPGLSIRWLAQDGVTVLLDNSTTFTPNITDVLSPGTTTFNVQAYDAVDSCFSALVPFILTIEASVSAGEIIV